MGMYPGTSRGRRQHPHNVEAFRGKYTGRYGNFRLKGTHQFRGIRETLARQQQTRLEAR